MVRAGADVVVGAHSHVAGPIEMVDGVPVLYSLGDLLFDLPRFEATEEAFLAELTFHRHREIMVERFRYSAPRANQFHKHDGHPGACHRDP